MPLIRRGFVLLLAYLASSLVASVAVIVISGFQQGAVVWKAQFEFILPIVLVLGVAVAWLPLTAALALTLRLLKSRLLATLCASVLTAFLLLAWQSDVVSRFLSVEVSPLAPPLWRQLLDVLPYAVIVGFVGGIVFWAIAYRGTGASADRPRSSA